MAEPIIRRLEERRNDLRGVTAIRKTKQTAVVNIPLDWWYTISTFEIIEPKPVAKVYKLAEINTPTERVKRLPRTKYWEIRQGDYRRHEPIKHGIEEARKTRKRIEQAGLMLAVLISTTITILFSYFISKII